MDTDDFPALPETAWDVVVSGTGVQESLMALSLSRAGLRVLQLDRNSYYGSTEAAFTLDELQSWCESLSKSAPTASTPYFAGQLSHTFGSTLPRGYTVTLAPHVVYWTSELLELLRAVEMTTNFTWQAMGSWWIYLTDAAVAVRPIGGGALGDMVMGAGMASLRAGTVLKKRAGGWNKNRKSMPASFAPPPPGDKEGAKTVTDGGASEGVKKEKVETNAELRKLGGILREVPCTFEDVAWSADLNDRDRGHLGSFLRFVTKCLDPNEHSTSTHASFFASHADTPFETFLSTVFPLPPSAIASLHSLTLLSTPPENTPLKEAVPRLLTHLNSLGRIADIRSTAALTVAYGGSAELCQIWSRGAAVAGALNVLERYVTAVNASDGAEELNMKLSTGETVTAKWLVSTSDNMPEGYSAAAEQAAGKKETHTQARGVFVLASKMEPLFERKHAEDRLSPSAVVVTFPAGSLGEDGTRNRAPIYVNAHAAGTYECPANHTLLYLSTLLAANENPKVAYKLFDVAVSHVVNACSSPTSPTTSDVVKLRCVYSQAYYTIQENAEKGSGIKILSGMPTDLVFPDAAVKECRSLYEKITGTGVGFCELPLAEREMMQQEEEGEMNRGVDVEKHIEDAEDGRDH